MTEAHKRANKKWEANHLNKQARYNDKSKTKRFILKEADLQELSSIAKWFRIRKRQLLNDN